MTICTLLVMRRPKTQFTEGPYILFPKSFHLRLLNLSKEQNYNFESAYDFLNFNHLQSSFLTPNLFQNTGLKNIFLEYQVEVVQHSFLKKFIKVSEIESFSSSSQKRKRHSNNFSLCLRYLVYTAIIQDEWIWVF